MKNIWNNRTYTNFLYVCSWITSFQKEPFFVYGTAFFAYTTCNLLSISSIFGVISCTFFMRPYVEANISPRNKTTIDFSIKLMAHIAEMMVFIFLGIVTSSVFDSEEPFEWSFNLWNILFVTIVRFLVVFALGYLLNLFSMRKLSFKDQFIGKGSNNNFMLHKLCSPPVGICTLCLLNCFMNHKL